MDKKKLCLIIIPIIMVLDQIAKILMINRKIIIIPELLNFTYTENTGAAFSIGASNSIIIVILNMILIGIIIKIMKDKIKELNNYTWISLNMMLAGGISNLIDRFFRGYVIDFIDVSIFNFPIFNLADISITIGAILLIIMIIKQIEIKSNKAIHK